MKRTLLEAAPALILLAALAPFSAAAPGPGPTPPKPGTDIVDAGEAARLRTWLRDAGEWVVRLDPGSGVLKNTEDTPDSIFINGNFARLLMALHRLTGERAWLDEAIRWCDTFTAQQRIVPTSDFEEGGFWVDLSRNPKGNIYFGDGGTAASALAVGCALADLRRKALYLKALERYANFVLRGTARDPQDLGREATTTWLIREGADKGALGCGYYLGHLSVKPYTVSTATTGGAFFAALHGLTGRPEYAAVARGAVGWLLRARKPDGEVPYILDGEPSADWPLDTLTYAAEAFVAADAYLGDPAVRELLGRELKPTVEWLLARQNPDGSWGEARSADQQRSPRVATLLAWFYRRAGRDERIRTALQKYCAFLLDPNNAASYGLKSLVRTTGFAGLSVAEILLDGSTY